VLNLPTRRGVPTKIGGLVDVVRSPSYSTGVGLVMFGAGQHQLVRPQSRNSDERPSLFKRAFGKIAEMF
jgi:cell division protein FtsA